MSSTLGGDDPAHDLSPEEKDRLEKKLRQEAEELRKSGDPRGRKRKLAQAIEISRKKSARAHQ
jgi:hypothetical protein